MWFFPGPAQRNSGRARDYLAGKYFFPHTFKVLHLHQNPEKASHKNQHFLVLKTVGFFFLPNLNKWDLNTVQIFNEDFDPPFFKA